MPPPPVPPNIPADSRMFQHVVLGKLHGQRTVNTFYTVVVDTVISEAELLQAGQQWWTHIKTEWLDAVSDDWTAEGHVSRVVGYPEIPSQTEMFPAAFVGAQVGPALPGTVAAVIRRMSYWGGKRGRGRLYIAGIREADSDNGVILADALAKLNGLAAKLVTAAAYGDFGTQAPYHFSRNKTGETGVKGTLLTKKYVDPVLGNQRRRRIGRGV